MAKFKLKQKEFGYRQYRDIDGYRVILCGFSEDGKKVVGFYLLRKFFDVYGHIHTWHRCEYMPDHIVGYWKK